VPYDLAVDMLLADTARDELSSLRAEVEDEHALGGESGRLLVAVRCRHSKTAVRREETRL
jgi:hypothetical protein